MADISIKLVPGFRGHILMALHFVTAYLECVEKGVLLGEEAIELPAPDTFSKITDAAEVAALAQRISATAEGDTIRLADRENIVLHACFVLMSYALVTPVGEMICSDILRNMPGDHPLRDFKEFRRHSLVINTHLIENAIETLDETPGFAAMQEALQALQEA